MLVRNDLALAHATAIDAAALDGSGSSNQPLGLLRTSGIGSVVISAGGGGAPTYSKILDLETAISDANADADRMAFLTTPIMRGKLRKLPLMDSNSVGLPTWENVPGQPGVGSLIGYPAYVSKNVAANKTSGANSDCHCIVLGYWPSLMIGEWGLIEILFDPFAQKSRG